MSTLLSETEVLYIYTLGNKDYFRKLFWATMAVNINAGEVRDTVQPMSQSPGAKPWWVPWTSLQKPHQLVGFY